MACLHPGALYETAAVDLLDDVQSRIDEAQNKRESCDAFRMPPIPRFFQSAKQRHPSQHSCIKAHDRLYDPTYIRANKYHIPINERMRDAVFCHTDSSALDVGFCGAS